MSDLKEEARSETEATGDPTLIPNIEIWDEQDTQTLYGTLRGSKTPVFLTFMDRDANGVPHPVSTLLMPNVKTRLLTCEDL